MTAGAAILLAAAVATTAGLEWMEGARCTEGGASQTCERWGPLEGGTMLGTSQTVRDGRTTGFEFMRIVVEDGIAVFHGSPDGAPPVAFRQADRGRGRIVFENPAHDFPQRIVYRREGTALVAEVSLLDGRKPMRWRYSRLIED